MKYKQITVSTTHEFSDILCLALFEVGSDGVSVSDSVEMKEMLKEIVWDYLDENFILEDCGVVLVSGFFDVDFNEKELAEELANLKSNSEIETGPMEMSSEIIDSASWENVWKKYYKPIKIKNISIVPMWLKNRHKNTVPVYINPGLAFGTGNHETTRMCIGLMQEIDLAGKIVADVGAGSGILGICAIKTGAKICIFYDTDPNAVKAAKENCIYNNIQSQCKVIAGSISKKTVERADVIIANLTADILILLYDAFMSMLNSGGKIIVSGIISAREKDVESVFYKDFNLIKKMSENDWRAILLEKK